MKIIDLVKPAPFRRRLLRFFYYKLPVSLKNFVLGSLAAIFKRHQCNICGCRKLDFVYATWANYFLKCPQCNVCFAAHLPSIKNIRRDFLINDDSGYWLKRGESFLPKKSHAQYWQGWIDWKISTFNSLNLEKFEKSISGCPEALEIGCAEGKVLEILRQRGWRATGLDISEYEARLCRRSGFEIIVGEAEKQNFKNASFDLVITFHTFEHTIDPVLVIKNIYNMLKRNGRLILEVPFLGTKNDFLRDFANPAHFYFFSQEGMQKLLTACGFVCLDRFIYNDGLHKPRRNICYLFEKVIDKAA